MDNTCTDCNELVRHCQCGLFSRRPMTLAEQIADARRVMAGWTDEKRRTVQLEGWDYRKTPNVGGEAHAHERD